MSRPIKVEDHIYLELARMRVGRQTFSDVVGHLLVVRKGAAKLVDILEEAIKHYEQSRERLLLHAPREGYGPEATTALKTPGEAGNRAEDVPREAIRKGKEVNHDH